VASKRTYVRKQQQENRLFVVDVQFTLIFMCNNFTLTFHSDCPACFGDNLNALRRRYNSILPTLFCEDWQKSPKLWFPQTSFDLWINVGLN